MECKNALADPEVAGDIQKAIASLRAKGITKAAQSTRATKEGLIGVYVSNERGTVTLVEVNCETGKISLRNEVLPHAQTVPCSLQISSVAIRAFAILLH